MKNSLPFDLNKLMFVVVFLLLQMFDRVDSAITKELSGSTGSRVYTLTNSYTCKSNTIVYPNLYSPFVGLDQAINYLVDDYNKGALGDLNKE